MHAAPVAQPAAATTLKNARHVVLPPPADPQLVLKRPMELACLMAVRNRLAAAIAHLELPPLSGGWRSRGWCWGKTLSLLLGGLLLYGLCCNPSPSPIQLPPLPCSKRSSCRGEAGMQLVLPAGQLCAGPQGGARRCRCHRGQLCAAEHRPRRWRAGPGAAGAGGQVRACGGAHDPSR